MPRRFLAVILGFGVLFGFGSGFASLAWHAHHGWGHGACAHGRYADWGEEGPRGAAAPAPQAQLQPQTVVVPAAAAPSPQVFIIMPGAGATPQVVTPAAAPAPAVAR
jgi:hypothetical protein